MDEYVVITGASSGIGKECASYLASQGFHVLAGVRNPKAAWQEERVTCITLDVTEKDSMEKAVREARPLLEGAKSVHLVNNAGLAVAGPVETVPLDRWREQFEVNVFGLVAATQGFLPFIRVGQGRIINISSVSGLAALPYLAPYAASKFAVEAISDSLRREMKQFGVRVVVVEPGPIDTPIWQKGMARREDLTAGMPANMLSLYQRELGRFQSLVEASARAAVPARKVSEVVLRALRSSRPRTRYLVGSAATKIQSTLLGPLPDRWVDSLIAKEFSK